MQISRLFEIVYLLLDRKSMTAKELASHFEVSTRTIYRDVDTLAQAGIPIYGSKGCGGGIHLTDNFVLNKSVLSKQEQRDIIDSLHGMNAMQAEKIRPVLTKLSALFGAEQIDWIGIDFSSWNPNCRINNLFEQIKGAILSRRIISFQYSPTNNKPMKRSAEPLKLVFRGYDWYLLAWCRLREDYRYFKLTRMEDLSVLEEQAERRALPEWTNNREKEPYINRRPELVIARLSSELSFRAYDEFPPERRRQEKDGSFTVELEMPDDEWLYHYLLTFGPGLKIIGPDRIKEKFLVRLKQTLDQYDI